MYKKLKYKLKKTLDDHHCSCGHNEIQLGIRVFKKLPVMQPENNNEDLRNIYNVRPCSTGIRRDRYAISDPTPLRKNTKNAI